VGHGRVGEYVGPVLIQERLIARVRELCEADERLDAALMYGSFASGEADAHSDVEFWLFFRPEWHGRVDPRSWCARVAPVRHLVRNEFGTDVAFFSGLVRGEFHFASADDIRTVRDWPARGAAVDRMVVVDRRGALRPAIEAVPERAPVPVSGAEVETLCGRFANWVVLAHQVAGRGEILRAWDALGHAHRHLLWMARLVEGSTAHWLTPSRGAEADLPAPAVAQLRDAIVASRPEDIRKVLRTTWGHGRRYWAELAGRHDLGVPDGLFAEIDAAL
jgi:lincosamide nucleotidyltransferase